MITKKRKSELKQLAEQLADRLSSKQLDELITVLERSISSRKEVINLPVPQANTETEEVKDE